MRMKGSELMGRAMVWVGVGFWAALILLVMGAVSGGDWAPLLKIAGFSSVFLAFWAAIEWHSRHSL